MIKKIIIFLSIVFIASVVFAGNCSDKCIIVSGLPVKYYANNSKVELMNNKQVVVINLNGYKLPLVKGRSISIPNCHKGSNGYYYCPSH